MNNTLKSIMIGTCQIACRYPELSLEDALGDARQLAGIIRRNGIEDAQKGPFSQRGRRQGPASVGPCDRVRSRQGREPHPFPGLLYDWAPYSARAFR